MSFEEYQARWRQSTYFELLQDRSIVKSREVTDTLVRQEASTMLRTLLRGLVDVHLCQYDKGHLGIVRDCCREGSDEPLDGHSKLGQEGPILWYRRAISRKPLDPAPV